MGYHSSDSSLLFLLPELLQPRCPSPGPFLGGKERIQHSEIQTHLQHWGDRGVC